MSPAWQADSLPLYHLRTVLGLSLNKRILLGGVGTENNLQNLTKYMEQLLPALKNTHWIRKEVGKCTLQSSDTSSLLK